jgi:two-component system copper resistance phosphate regulon response regulator CusR
MKVLVVEDYEPLRFSLVKGLTEAGYVVEWARDGETALDIARSNTHDVVVLDLMLPRLDGLSVLKKLRLTKNQARILIVTARDAVSDRVKGLNAGADDYLVKPFDFDELLARVKALQRRTHGLTGTTITVSDLTVDLVARTVERGGRRVDLTAREYAILEVLAVRRGQVVTRSEVWNRIYDYNSEVNSNVVDVYIGYLRKKLEADGLPRLIHTRRGLGYVLEDALP